MSQRIKEFVRQSGVEIQSPNSNSEKIAPKAEHVCSTMCSEKTLRNQQNQREQDI